jgi:hypothetical protein
MCVCAASSRSAHTRGNITGLRIQLLILCQTVAMADIIWQLPSLVWCRLLCKRS